MRKRKESNLLLCRALGHRPETKKKDPDLSFAHQATNALELSHTHTLVNVEFLHQSEDVFGENFGLDQAHTLFGHREVRELPVEHTHTHTSSFSGLTGTYMYAAASRTFQLHDPYLLISSSLKLGWHHESSSKTSCCSRWSWPVTKDSAMANLFCRISGTHICRRRWKIRVWKIGEQF